MVFCVETPYYEHGRGGVQVEDAVEITAGGAKGMVVKPQAWVTRGRRGLAQPAIKCRGREYLRIIYGPEYTAPEHLERLHSRGLSHKRPSPSASTPSDWRP